MAPRLASSPSSSCKFFTIGSIFATILTVKETAAVTQIVGYAREDIARFARRETDSLKPYSVLAEKLGWDRSHIGNVLRHYKIGEERKRVKETRANEPFSPSPELAWMIGFMSCQANVITSAHNARLQITVQNPDVRQKFLDYAGKVLPEKGKKKLKAPPSNRVSLREAESVRRLGDISRKGFANTFQERYQWILSSEQYRWAFIEGCAEQRAFVDERSIRFQTNIGALASVLSQMLQENGISKAKPYERPTNSPTDAWMVGIYTFEEVRIIAQHIHFADPEKEAILQSIRETLPLNKATALGALREWQRIKNQLGSFPSLRTVSNLRKLGQSRYSEDVFRRVIGEGILSQATARLKHMDSLSLGFTTGNNKEKVLSDPELLLLFNFARKPYLDSTEAAYILGARLKELANANRFIADIQSFGPRLDESSVDAYTTEVLLRKNIEGVMSAETLPQVYEAFDRLHLAIQVAVRTVERGIAEQSGRNTSYNPSQRLVNRIGHALFGVQDTTRLVKSYTREIATSQPKPEEIDGLLREARTIMDNRKRPFTAQEKEKLLGIYTALGNVIFNYPDISLITQVYSELKNGEKPLNTRRPAQGK